MTVGTSGIHSKTFFVNTSDGTAGFAGTVTIGGTDLTTSNTLNTNTDLGDVGLSLADISGSISGSYLNTASASLSAASQSMQTQLVLTGGGMDLKTPGGVTLASYGTNVTIGKATGTESNVFIDSDSVDIRTGTNVTASFGATTTIGNTEQEHIKITSNKFELKRGSEVFVSASSAGLYTSGSINASSGEIAGWAIGSNTLQKLSGNAGITLDAGNNKIVVSGSGTTSGNSVRLFGNTGVIEVSQSGAGVFDTGRTKIFTTDTFIQPHIFKPAGTSKGYASSSITVTEPAPTMNNIDITGNMEVGGLTKTDKLMIDSDTLSTPFVFEHQIQRNSAATNPDGAVNPTASFAAIHSTNYSGNNQDVNCHPAFVFSADYFTELETTNDSIGWVQAGSPTSGSNIFTIAASVKDVDNTDFADAKFNVLGLEANTSGVEIGLQNQYTFLQAKHSGSVRVQIQHDGDIVSKGNITAFGTSFLTVSDEREKKDIYTISESLDRILELRPTKFTWKESEKQDVGFIAQEVEQIIPEVIETSRGFINTDNDQERKTIAYTKLVPYLVDTIQVMEKRIKELEKKVK